MKMQTRGVSLLKGGAFLMYGLLKLLSTQHKLVLISRLQNHTSIDFKRIAQEASTMDPSLKVVVLNHKMSNRFLHIFAILQEMYHLATAEACVVESYVISVSILRHRKSLVIVQLWHALGAIKNFGHLAIGKPEGSPAKIAQLMNMHKNYTYVATGSAHTIPIFAKAFNVPKDIVKPIGMPRVDYLLDASLQAENVRMVRGHYKLQPAKKTILYIPTFRKHSNIPYDKLVDQVDLTKYNLIIKQHPRDKTRIVAREKVIIDHTFELLQLLPVADYVISDYSAAVFEAALLEKPLFFWTYDEKRYAKRRGFALDYARELPGIKSTSAREIVAAIDNNQYDTQQIASFAKRYIAVQDGSSTHKLLELLGLQI